MRYGGARFEVLTAVLMNIQVFWNVTLCLCVSTSSRRFGISVLNFRVKEYKKLDCLIL